MHNSNQQQPFFFAYGFDLGKIKLSVGACFLLYLNAY